MPHLPKPDQEDPKDVLLVNAQQESLFLFIFQESEAKLLSIPVNFELLLRVFEISLDRAI